MDNWIIKIIAKGIVIIHTSKWSLVALACSGSKQGLGSHPGTEVRSQQWEHQILVTGPHKGLGLSALQKKIPTKMESSEKSKVFITRKKSPVHVAIHTGGQTHKWVQRELLSLPLWWPELLLWGVSSTFSWLVILTCLVQSPYLVYLRILPCVCTYHLVKMDFTKEVYG